MARVEQSADGADAGRGPAGAGRVTRRRARTRARLLEAAFTVFAEKGFGHVSIEEVCAAAGFTRGAFYSNFGTLDELFFALYQDRAELITAQVTEALAQRGTDYDVGAAVDRVTEVLLLDRDWLLVKTDFLVHAARDPEVADALLEHRRRLREAIVRRLAALAEYSELPSVLGGAEGVAHAFIAVYDGVTTQLLLDQDTEHARAWLRQLLMALLFHPGAPDDRGPDDRVR